MGFLLLMPCPGDRLEGVAAGDGGGLFLGLALCTGVGLLAQFGGLGASLGQGYLRVDTQGQHLLYARWLAFAVDALDAVAVTP
ncbi:hypothetical protein D3C80_1411690 [compost metagenome]